MPERLAWHEALLLLAALFWPATLLLLAGLLAGGLRLLGPFGPSAGPGARPSPHPSARHWPRTLAGLALTLLGAGGLLAIGRAVLGAVAGSVG